MAAGPSSKLEELEDRLESFIENLRVVGVIAGNFQQNGQGVLNERLNTAVEHMRMLDREKDNFSDIDIPVQVLNYVDDGRNPDLFTQHQLEKTLGDYQAVQRKTETYKMFRDELVRQLESSFPVEVNAYLAHRQMTRPSS
ncbi:PREDICTED: mediator of RNA polymerase II transcription subunit 10-like [Amphimedon queenslandica]|nr:PREDICTED: mediator of RNA polymerase II transcription subunit 10-like [Amphimedon queenslandica]|eukprot:XP_011408963.1 PREDICTED: mediator of RNA polymerase II transcription subunit 10-like [Amphimedon queenslandica]